MVRLRNLEILDLTAAIGDSNLLTIISKLHPDRQLKFIRRSEFPPPLNRQGTLQVFDQMLAFSEDPEFMRSIAETRRNCENEKFEK
jgi:hypothetical protein